MKANDAPEKIYLNWVNYPLEEMQVEYTRTDAFVKKATKWLEEQEEMIGVSFQEDFLERFQDYMKGE